MSLSGLGVDATWHDVAPAVHDEFREWHTREHLPARAGIPGVRRARRYVALRDTPEFFTLIEADSLEVLTGQDYRRRLDAPTASAKRLLPALANVAAAVARVPFTQGVGSGGVLLTLRFAIGDAHGESTQDALRRRVLPPLAYRKGVTGVHLCVADDEASGTPSAESALYALGESPHWFLLVEGSAVPDVEGAADDLAPALQAHGARDLVRASYRLEFTRLTTPWAAG